MESRPSRGMEGRRQARLKTIRDDDAVGSAAVASLPPPCICTCCSGSCCRGLPTSASLLVGFGSFSARRTANVTFAMIVSVVAAARPSICGRGRGKKAPCAVQITVDRCGDLPPSFALLATFSSAPRRAVAVDGDDPRPRRHMAIIAPIQDRGAAARQTDRHTFCS